MKKTSLFVAFLCVLALVFAVSCKATSSNSITSNSDTKVSVVYEGVFINNVQEMLDIIDQVRGDNAPYEHLKNDEFHVTVSFEPEQPMLHKVGAKVNVYITGYDKEMVTVDGVEAYAEALSVRLHTDDEDLQQCFEKTV